MLKSDRWIRDRAAEGMIAPFVPSLVREVTHILPGHAPFGHFQRPVLSFGVSSYGYDLRLSAREFLIFRHVPGTVMNPKRFNSANLEPAELHADEYGSFFILPAHTYGLGVALERLRVPPNVTVICLGKSTYARLGIIVNTTPAEACLSADSEVLCRTGWKPISDVIIGEDVLCLDNGAAVYQPVQQFHRYYHNGDMLAFASRTVSQLVTPAHKMWASFKKKRVEAGLTYPGGRLKGTQRKAEPVFEFERMAAQSVFGKHNLFFLRDVDWAGSRIGPTVKVGEREYPVDAWLRFLGCWLGDGSAYIAKGANYMIKLAVVTKERKRAYFREVLVALGVAFNESKYGFSFQHKSTCLYLMQYKGAHNKRIPREYTVLPPDQLALLREGMMHSDGCIANSTYVSVSKQLTDDFQEICLKIGDYATAWQKESTINGKSFSAHLCRFSSRRSSPSKMLPENCSKVPYAGFVYDLTVPSHVFLMRHNGRASWTGNSWEGHLTLEFSNSSGADCRIYSNEGICQLLFFEGEQCETTYRDRFGKYQDQPERVTLAKV
jgi:dCTP deaminase